MSSQTMCLGAPFNYFFVYSFLPAAASILYISSLSRAFFSASSNSCSAFSGKVLVRDEYRTSLRMKSLY
jgi:hypothetical protein